jgi:uncharacterized membrane protein
MQVDLIAPATAKRRHASTRVASIDAARGTAMLFVCLAHFTNSYFFLIGEEEIGSNLVAIGMVASPTFVTVSGLVAGFLAVTRHSSFPDLRLKLIDRGFFLLVVGHLVLALAGFAAGSGFVHSYRVEYITDAIGFAILIGPSLVKLLRARSRLLIAAAVFALDWLAIVFWSPSGGVSSLVKLYLVGVVKPEGWGVSSGGFPALPWFAVYLLGTVIGERVGEYYSGNAQRAAHVFLAKIGAIAAGCAFGVKIGLGLLSRSASLAAQLDPSFAHFLSPYQKFPPGPVYLLFFGGTGMLLVAAVLEAGRRGVLPLLFKPLRQIGLASFFVYIVQFYLYSVILHTLRLPYTPFWPLIFLFSIILLAAVATVWNRKAGNQFLTVGLAPLLNRIARGKREILDKRMAIGARIT